MAKLSEKEFKTMNIVRRALSQNAHGLTFDQLLQSSRADSVSLRQGLTLLGAKEELGIWYLPSKSSEVPSTEKVKAPRSKPFTPNPIMGYQVQYGKAKIFLDRKASSRTLTLSLKDLKELVNAVEKAERIA